MVTLSVQPLAMVGAKGIKRESSELDDDVLMASTENVRPLKRVRFSDQEISQELRKKIVFTALEEQNKTGKAPQFDELRKKFTARPSDSAAPDSTELGHIISCLTLVVSQLDRHCTPLVGDIIHMNWAGRDGGFQKTYLTFLLHLISAHPRHVAKIVQMMVKHLTYETAKEARRFATTSISREAIFSTVHDTLRAILGLVPTAWTPLLAAVSAVFPFKGQKKIHQTTYIHNLLKIMEYAQASKTKILGLIFEKMIQLDVEIQINLDELEEGEGEELDRHLKMSIDAKTGQNTSDSGLGEEEDSEDSDSDDDEDEDLDSGEPRTLETIKETVNKLDVMLNIMFTFYSSRLPSESTPEPKQEEVETFELLLHFFDTIILTTFRSQYVQFIVFWAAQKSPIFIDIFLGMLVERAMDNSKPQVARQAAAAYIASFVARAKNLDRNAVRSVVQMLCMWLEKFLRDREVECVSPDVRKFGGFYAVTQAVLYIYCFRWRDLRGKTPHAVGDEEELEDIYAEPNSWAPGLQVIERLITSKFNPLKICSPSVVKQFADVANHFNFVYCFTIMERNKRGNLFNSGSMVSTAGHPEATQLESYFPFDPFKLATTKKWVEPLYVQWQPVPGLYQDEDEDGYDEDEDGDEDDEEAPADSAADNGSEDEDEDSDDDE